MDAFTNQNIPKTLAKECPRSDKRSAFMAVEYEGVYKNQAVYKIAVYDINIDRLKNSFGESTIRNGFFSMSLDSQCGPSMR